MNTVLAFLLFSVPLLAQTPFLLVGAPGEAVGSRVSPTFGPSGLVGTEMLNHGKITYSAQGGVAFGPCCTNFYASYYHFAGSGLSDVFGSPVGQISFVLRSSYSFASRPAAGSRYAFDVRDSGGEKFTFYIAKSAASRLSFVYLVAGTRQEYDVPVGNEEALYGQGVSMSVTLTWDGATATLYLNGNPAKATPYTPPVFKWGITSIFNLGAMEYATATSDYGGTGALEDTIANFAVLPGVALASSVPLPMPPSTGVLPPPPITATDPTSIKRWVCAGMAANADCSGLTVLGLTFPDGSIGNYYAVPYSGAMPPVAGAGEGFTQQ